MTLLDRAFVLRLGPRPAEEYSAGLPDGTSVLGRLATEIRCVRCGHLIVEHGAEGDRPDLDPSYMVCEVQGCECVDFHHCWRDDCPECAGSDDPRRHLGLRQVRS